MKTLAIFDRKDYKTSDSRYIKKSARAIIFREGKIALNYSSKYEFYSFPGRTLEERKTRTQALIREVREETGLVVIPESIRELGMIREIRKDIKVENGIYDLQDFYYFCDTEETVTEQNLTQDETEAGYQLEFVSINEAILLNEKEIHIRRIYTEPETFVLKLLLTRESGKPRQIPGQR